MDYILKRESEYGNIYSFNLDNDYFYITYHKGLDYLKENNNLIIWYTILNNKDFKTFKITKKYIELYNLIDSLYTNIVTCNIFNNDEKNSYIKNIQKYSEHPLYINNNVEYHSDNDYYNKANMFSIYKYSDDYIIKFGPNINNHTKYQVIISNNKTRYHYFNILFMKMFNDLEIIYKKSNNLTYDEYLSLKKTLNK